MTDQHPSDRPAPPAAPAYGTPSSAQPYGQYAAGPGGSYAPVAAAPTNGLAIASLILSLVGVHLGGIICGHLALSQIRTSGQGGRGLAIAGLILGYVFFAFVLVMIVVVIIVFLVSGVFLFGTAAGTSG